MDLGLTGATLSFKVHFSPICAEETQMGETERKSKIGFEVQIDRHSTESFKVQYEKLCVPTLHTKQVGRRGTIVHTDKLFHLLKSVVTICTGRFNI